MNKFGSGKSWRSRGKPLNLKVEKRVTVFKCSLFVLFSSRAWHFLRNQTGEMKLGRKLPLMKPIGKIVGGFARALASKKGLCSSKFLRNSSPLLLCDFINFSCIFLRHLGRARERGRRRFLVFPLACTGF